MRLNTEPFNRTERRPGLLPIEMVTLFYALLTLLMTVIKYPELHHPGVLLADRLLIILGIGILAIVYYYRPSEGTRLFRTIFPVTLLAYWYPDTYEFCSCYPYLDHLFAEADATLFGCQPSMVFSENFSGVFWSELFHLGYFSYYPMIAVAIVAPLFTSRRLFEKQAFIIITCFLLYYIIYLFLPVAGPQYYFDIVGQDAINSIDYPSIGTYLRDNAMEPTQVGPDGPFHRLVAMMQGAGERPTAAFPSSHVGISTILMILLFRHERKLAWGFLPLYVILCFSTVYIQAHYLVDVFGGLVSGAVFYVFAHWLYGLIHVKHPTRRHHHHHHETEDGTSERIQ